MKYKKLSEKGRQFPGFPYKVLTYSYTAYTDELHSFAFWDRLLLHPNSGSRVVCDDYFGTKTGTHCIAEWGEWLPAAPECKTLRALCGD